jgi:hypothetical protein
LGATHIRTLFVDPACAGSAEEGAGSFRVRVGLHEQSPMIPSNVLCFDFEYGQSFDAAVMTTPPAYETSFVKSAQLLNLSIHFLIEVSKTGQ